MHSGRTDRRVTTAHETRRLREYRRLPPLSRAFLEGEGLEDGARQRVPGEGFTPLEFGYFAAFVLVVLPVFLCRVGY